MLKEHEVKNKLKISVFIKKIKAYGYQNIEATAHAFMRVSEKQRKIYTEEELKKIIFDLKPLEIGIQGNGNYATIYSYNDKKYIKILLDLTPNKVYIVTFYFLNREQQKRLKK